MRGRVVCAIAIGASTPSRADSPWVLDTTAGLALHETRTFLAVTSAGPAATLDLGFRMHPLAAAGLHLGGQRVRAGAKDGNGHYEVHDDLELEAGLSVHASFDRLSLLPWIGVQGFQDRRQAAGGVTIGIDIVVFGHDRLGAFAATSYGETYQAACLGVGYRYW